MAVDIQWTLSIGPEGPAGLDKAQNAFEASFASERFEASEREQRSARLQGPLARILERKLKAFQQALDQFEWPDTGSMAAAPEALAERILTSLPDDDNRQRTVKHLSRGYEPTHPVDLEAGEYEFVLSQGANSEVVTIDVEEDWTNADMLHAVADAVNDSSLPANAEVVTQGSPEQRVQGLMATGQALVITVNQAEPDQVVSLKDTSGHLIQGLKLKTLETPLSSAEKGVHYLQGTQIYRPTEYASKAFDPNEETSLAAGVHEIDYEIGPHSGTVSFDVEEGDTWSEVLGNVAGAFASESSYLTAETFDQTRPSTLLTDGRYELMDGLAVRVEAVDPKLGWRLSLSGDDLDDLAMSGTAYPGTDAHMRIDGTEEVASPGVFATDQGRLLMALSDSFGDTLPLHVVSSIDRVESVMAGVVDAYNDLQKTLVRNKDLLEDGYADRWRAPVAAQAGALESIGLQKFGKNDELWLNRDAFHTALGARSDTVRGLLDDGPLALIPMWKAATEDALSAGAPAAVLPVSETPAKLLSEPSPRTENELAKGAMLLDLYDALPSDPTRDTPVEPGSPLVSAKG